MANLLISLRKLGTVTYFSRYTETRYVFLLFTSPYSSSPFFLPHYVKSPLLSFASASGLPAVDVVYLLKAWRIASLHENKIRSFLPFIYSYDLSASGGFVRFVVKKTPRPLPLFVCLFAPLSASGGLMAKSVVPLLSHRVSLSTSPWIDIPSPYSNIVFHVANKNGLNKHLKIRFILFIPSNML